MLVDGSEHAATLAGQAMGGPAHQVRSMVQLVTKTYTFGGEGKDLAKNIVLYVMDGTLGVSACLVTYLLGGSLLCLAQSYISHFVHPTAAKPVLLMLSGLRSEGGTV